MLRIFIFTVLIGLLNPLFAQDITGDWGGALEVQGIQLRLIFHITEEGNTYVATMDSPDQGATGIVVDKVVYDFPDLALSIDRMNFVYKGAVNNEFSKIKGSVTQSGAQLAIELQRMKKGEKIANRPQKPRKPFPYITEEVSYFNTNSRQNIAGTLTLPASGNVQSAVILISGSGPQNRDEEILEHQPFLVLADYLTRQGIAVLRFDDRGVGQSGGDFSKATTADFVTDVEAGITFLKTRKEIDSNKIGLIGHSEGGIIAPMIAAKDNSIDFVVMLAGAGIPITELMKLQRAKLTEANDESGASSINEKMLKKTHKILKKDKSDTYKREKLTRYVAKQFDKFPTATKKELGGKEAFVPAFLAQVLNPWYQYFITIEPDDYLTKVNCPVLALNGQKDLQVTAKENIRGIEASLTKGGNTQFTTRVLPELNHLFQHCETGSPSEYGEIEETFDPETLELIGQWILER